MFIRLEQAHLAVIEAAARSAYPAECCGLLIGARQGGGYVVDQVVESDNLAATPHDSFEIDMRLRVRLQRTLRGTNRDIIGHYHSHPNGVVEPSPRDAAQAWEPDLVWLIVGVTQAGAGQVHAFQFDADNSRFGCVPLEIS